ncbi:hypothetical protein ACSBLW_09930 [Thioclava sp. FR2]|uniref:hypothetical protein n=1 Tax=Thioclava sp. FR2 TaxID=3445780 RepID=UPI003EBA51C1
MAAIFIVTGGVLGFFSAIAALLVVQTGLLVAVAVWFGIGFSFTGLGLLTALLPRRMSDSTDRVRQSQSA